MGEPFGVVQSTWWRSRKGRPLSRDAKLLYLYLHSNPHRNALGLYKLPIAWAADDIDCQPEIIRDCLVEITAAGLADYDYDETLVRVKNWELMNKPDGPSDGIGRIQKGFDGISTHPFKFAAFACFMREILMRAKLDKWKDSDVKTKLENLASLRVEEWFCDHPDEFMLGLSLAGIAPSDLVFDRAWEQVSYRVDRPSRYPLGTIPYRYPIAPKDTDTDTEQDTDRDRETDRETDTAAKRKARAARPPQPAPPAEGRQAGAKPAKKTPPDVQRDIDSLGKGKK